MEAPALLTGRRCSWCGTLNPLTDNACSKCGAVLSSIQPAVAIDAAEPSVAMSSQPEPNNSGDHEAVLAVVDSSMFDKISSEAMKGLGLGPTFVSAYSLALVVAGLLSLFILISLASAVVDISLMQLLSKTTSASTAVGVNESLILSLVIRFLLVGILLLTAVFFLIWIYRTHKNLTVLGATELKYSPGWAVGGFFVPLVNLFRPYQVVTEIWKASAREARRGGGINWKYEHVPVYFGVWWGLGLLSGFFNFFSTFVILGGGQTNQLLVASRYRIVYTAVNIAYAALAIAVVMRITARQETTNRANSSMAEPT